MGDDRPAPRADRVTHRLFFLAVPLALAACSDGRPAHRVASDAPLSKRLAGADADYGRQIFYRCAACHNMSEGAGDRNGPNLWGVLGRPVATGSQRFGYTGALKAFGGTWTCARLDDWLADPMRTVPGTQMTFGGLPDGADRADVIAWLARNGGVPAAARCQGLRTDR
jgi:cytochrome c